MTKHYTLSLNITQKEIEFLKSLLKDEVFQLSGLKLVATSSEIKEDLQVAETLEKKIEEAQLVAA
jgi:hypothetical protein